MNEKKILIVNEERNNVLESEIKKLLEGVGIGVDKFDLYTPSHNRLLDGEELPPHYRLVVVLYSHSEEEVEQDAHYCSRRLHTHFVHGLLTAKLGLRKIGVVYLPDSSPRLNAQHFFIEAGVDSHWKVRLLNQLRKSGFEIDEAKFIELAKSV